MRKLHYNTHKYTEVFAMDKEGPGNGNHVYDIKPVKGKEMAGGALRIRFQKGPLKENKYNGIRNEDLLSIIIDRLNGFQEGPYRCRENGKALVDLYGALQWLRERTKKREKRGVEGTSEK